MPYALFLSGSQEVLRISNGKENSVHETPALWLNKLKYCILPVVRYGSESGRIYQFFSAVFKKKNQTKPTFAERLFESLARNKIEHFNEKKAFIEEMEWFNWIHITPWLEVFLRQLTIVCLRNRKRAKWKRNRSKIFLPTHLPFW